MYFFFGIFVIAKRGHHSKKISNRNFTGGNRDWKLFDMSNYIK